MDMAAFVEDAIFEAQRDLRHLHRHREPADDEHPQDRTRPAHRQRDGDPGYIAEANGAGQGGGERRVRVDDVALENEPFDVRLGISTEVPYEYDGEETSTEQKTKER